MPGKHGSMIADRLAEAVAASGCRHLFTLMGDGNMTFVIACEEAGLEVIEVRHEGAALAMAEGYGWATDSVGICSVTHGPGLTQLATGLVVASRNRSSVVAVVAEVPSGYRGAQTFDQEGFVSACEGAYVRLQAEQDPAQVLHDAVQLAVDRRGPVVLAVAADLLSATAPQARATTWRGPVARQMPSTADSGRAAERLLAALSISERPVFVAGRGVVDAGVGAEVAALAERFGAALATTLPAKGLFDGNPLDIGISGGLGHPPAARVLRDADLVVGFGTSLGSSTTRNGGLFPDARLLRITDELGAAPSSPPREDLLGEIAATVVAAMGEVTDAQATRAPWFELLPPSAECWQEDFNEHSPQIADRTVDPRRALAAIDPHIPQDALIVMSNGHCSGFVAGFVSCPPAGRFFLAQGFGSIGQAFTTALGVAFGAGERKVVVFEGDAAFMMHAQEVETAARAGTDVTVFVLNDDALGTEFQRLDRSGDRADLAVVLTADITTAVGGFGARAYAITGLASAGEVAEQALRTGLAVVDVRTSRSVRSRHMRLPTGERSTTAPTASPV
jgi:acetolactate synthase-1/2/3 large subunit